VLAELRDAEVGVGAEGLGEHLLGHVALDFQGPHSLLHQFVQQFHVLQPHFFAHFQPFACYSVGQCLLVLLVEAEMGEFELSAFEYAGEYGPADFVYVG
jgi:hypothetical protein